MRAREDEEEQGKEVVWEGWEKWSEKGSWD